MKKRCRHKRRNLPQAPRWADAKVPMFAWAQSEPSWHNWRYREVTLRTAQQMVADGEAAVVTREHDGKLLTMYRESVRPNARVSKPSPCTLTMATMLAAAKAAGGEELTTLEAAHVVKLRMWPLEYDRRNAATVVAGSAADRRAAETELRRAQGGGRYSRDGKVQAVHYAAAA